MDMIFGGLLEDEEEVGVEAEAEAEPDAPKPDAASPHRCIACGVGTSSARPG